MYIISFFHKIKFKDVFKTKQKILSIFACLNIIEHLINFFTTSIFSPYNILHLIMNYVGTFIHIVCCIQIVVKLNYCGFIENQLDFNVGKLEIVVIKIPIINYNLIF